MPSPVSRITRLGEARAWIQADVERYLERGRGPAAVVATVARTPQLRWQVRLRLTELAVNGGAPWVRAARPLQLWRPVRPTA